jgi:hypothetical protein
VRTGRNLMVFPRYMPQYWYNPYMDSACHLALLPSYHAIHNAAPVLCYSVD